jgi:23S rRNA (uridine2479-2'-O)-methyltransferase
MPPIRRIRSADAEFQLLHALVDNRRQRARQHRFLVEGVRAIDRAVAHGWPLDALVHGEGRLLSRWARDLLSSDAAGETVELAPALMAELSGKEETSELIAVARLPPDDLDRIAARPELLVVAFDRPVGPGNLGSVIRSADAFGADGVVVTGHGADPYDPAAVRASMGSLFALPVVRAGDAGTLGAWLARLRAEAPALRVVGSSANAETPLPPGGLQRPLVLVVGNETRGLSRGWRERCDELLRIPMRGGAGSLNVAAAAAILLHEVARAGAGTAGGEGGIID